MSMQPVTNATLDDIARAREAGLAPEELMRLAVHPSAKVRAVIAERADCPVNALMGLGHDRDATVLQALLRNRKTPASVVRALADNRDQRISDLAVQRLRNSFI